MEDILNKLKESARKFLKDFMADLPGNAVWVFLLFLSWSNYRDFELYSKDAPSVMQEIAALQFSVKSSVLLCGAAVVYYLHAIFRELKIKNEMVEKKSKK